VLRCELTYPQQDQARTTLTRRWDIALDLGIQRYCQVDGLRSSCR
jgi:hypothetical protein